MFLDLSFWVELLTQQSLCHVLETFSPNQNGRERVMRLARGV